MAFNKNLKEFIYCTTVPYNNGERYEAIVSDVSIVKGVKDPANEYVRIVLQVPDHADLQLFGTLYDTIDENGNTRGSLFKRIAKQLSEACVSDTAFNVVEYLARLEASSHTNNPETIGVYVLTRAGNNNVYLSETAYKSAVEWYMSQDANVDTDFSVLG